MQIQKIFKLWLAVFSVSCGSNSIGHPPTMPSSQRSKPKESPPKESPGGSKQGKMQGAAKCNELKSILRKSKSGSRVVDHLTTHSLQEPQPKQKNPRKVRFAAQDEIHIITAKNKGHKAEKGLSGPGIRKLRANLPLSGWPPNIEAFLLGVEESEHHHNN